MNAPKLAHSDFNQGFILDVDACDQSIGAVISQKVNGEEHDIGFVSRTLRKSECAYCVTRKQLLALVIFVKHFKNYRYGKKFLVKDGPQLYKVAHEPQNARRTDCQLDRDIVLLLHEG